MHPVTLDFETLPIRARPNYPPEPVGFSLKKFGEPAHYYAFGHKSGGNNCTKAEALKALKEAWNSKDGVLCHSAKFLEV